MRTLSAPELLDLWERAEPLDPPARALALAAAGPGPTADAEALAALPLGARDGRLLGLRAAWSEALAGQAACPACGERVEFALDGPALAGLAAAGATPQPLELDGMRILWRCPDSRDLVASAAAGNLADAERVLLRRCVRDCRDADGAAHDPSALPAPARAALAAAMTAADPLAEVVLDLGCPACDARFPCEVDLADFVWSELRARALRLVAEVDALARAYGWSEAEALALAPARRAAYLELVWGAEA